MHVLIKSITMSIELQRINIPNIFLKTIPEKHVSTIPNLWRLQLGPFDRPWMVEGSIFNLYPSQCFVYNEVDEKYNLRPFSTYKPRRINLSIEIGVMVIVFVPLQNIFFQLIETATRNPCVRKCILERFMFFVIPLGADF